MIVQFVIRLKSVYNANGLLFLNCTRCDDLQIVTTRSVRFLEYFVWFRCFFLERRDISAIFSIYA